jgi:ferritin-like metal-binding protein YciE
MKNGLHKLFLDELADIHYAEVQLTKALPKLAKASECDELRSAFESHLRETETHVSRLERVFELLNERPRKKKCDGMLGIIDEGKEMLSDNKGEPTADAALIAAAQKAEHYEIATYGTLVTWAKTMHHDEAARLLEETLAEEKAADEKLTEIAQSVANPEAEMANA